MIVFDSGALIAIVDFEPGALFARRLLRKHRGACFIHAVNLLEVYYGFLRVKGVAHADKTLDFIERHGVEVRADSDRAFLQDAGFLKVSHQTSLADTFGVALARRLGCQFASTDHHELDAVHAAGVCDVIFIR